MESYIIILLIIIILGVIILVIWLAYSVTAAYQQTLTITIPFQETYRYVPKLSSKKWKLDSIKIKVTGSMKRDKELKSTLVHGNLLEDLVNENIITPYKDCLLMQESNIFTVDEKILRRCPLTKNPTIENLSIIFFNKLAKLTDKIGCQLVSVKLASEGLKIMHSRYKN